MNTFVSAIYGQYDTPPPPPPGPGVLFTEDYSLAAEGWEVRVTDPFPHLHPRLKAKAVKCQPHRFHPEHPKTIWCDGNMHVQEAANDLDIYPLGFFRHPDRDNVAEEANVSRSMEKYRGLPVIEQANAYLAGGLPRGLWASGFHTRDISVSGVVEFFDAWWLENILWTYQDQLSLPWAKHTTCVDIVDLDGSLWASPWFGIGRHNRAD